jgi:hypothetical protein
MPTKSIHKAAALMGVAVVALPSQTALELAVVARVPNDNRPEFCGLLTLYFERMQLLPKVREQEDKQRAERLNSDRQVTGLFDALHEVREQFVNLPIPAKLTIGAFALRRAIHGSVAPEEILRQVEDLGSSLDAIKMLLSYRQAIDELHSTLVDLFLSKAAERDRAAEQTTSPRGGAPSKSPDIPNNPSVSIFDHFIINVAKIVYAHGGKLTLDKNRGSGTAIDFLRIAERYLPRDFVPPGILAAEGEDVLRGFARLRSMITRGRSLARGATTGQKPVRT